MEILSECLERAVATEICLGHCNQVGEECLSLDRYGGVRGMGDCSNKGRRLPLLDRARSRD
jgi:hypothetical protein